MTMTTSIKSGSNAISNDDGNMTEYETLDIIDINSKSSNYITIDKIQFKKIKDNFTDLSTTSFQTLSVGSDVSFNMIDIIVESNVQLEIKKNTGGPITATLSNILLFKRPSIIYSNSGGKKTSQIHFVFKNDNDKNDYRHIIHELEPVNSKNSSTSTIVNSILDNLMDIIYKNNDLNYELNDDTLKKNIRNILNDKNNLVYNNEQIIEIESQSDNDEIIINLTNILPDKYEVSHDKVYKSQSTYNSQNHYYYYIQNSKLSYDNMYFILFEKNNIVEFDETPVQFTQDIKKYQIGINEGEYNNNMSSEKPNTTIVERNVKNKNKNILFVTFISLSILFALISINIYHNNPEVKRYYYVSGFFAVAFFIAGLVMGFSVIK